MPDSPQQKQVESGQKYNNIVGYLTGSSLFKKQQIKRPKRTSLFPNTPNSVKQSQLKQFNYHNQGNRITSISDEIGGRKRPERQNQTESVNLDFLQQANKKLKEYSQVSKSKSKSKQQKQIAHKSSEDRLKLLILQNNSHNATSNKAYKKSFKEPQQQFPYETEKMQHQPVHSPILSKEKGNSRDKHSSNRQSLPGRYSNQRHIINAKTDPKKELEPDTTFPITSESRLVSSRKRYFQECRVQASEYLFDLRQQLFQSQQIIEKFKLEVKYEMQERVKAKKIIIKEDLFAMVERLTQQWQQKQLYLLSENKLAYLDDILEIQEQIQERVSKINLYIQKMNGQQNYKSSRSSKPQQQWRQISAHLLVSDDEENAVLQAGAICHRVQQSFQQKLTRAQIMLDESDCGIPLNQELNRAFSQAELRDIEQSIFLLIRNRDSQQKVQYSYPQPQTHKNYQPNIISRSKDDLLSDSEPQFVARFAKIRIQPSFQRQN